MLAEFARVVSEAQPEWWLMENVPQVPDVHVAGYTVQRFNANATEFGCRQNRNRRFQFGSRDGVPILPNRWSESHFVRVAATVLAGDDRTKFQRLVELQGLPRGFTLPGLSRTAKIRAIGNGVPVPMAYALACAIRDRCVTAHRLCVCGCGRVLDGPTRQKSATAACRKRIERSRSAPSHAARHPARGLGTNPPLDARAPPAAWRQHVVNHAPTDQRIIHLAPEEAEENLRAA